MAERRTNPFGIPASMQGKYDLSGIAKSRASKDAPPAPKERPQAQQAPALARTPTRRSDRTVPGVQRRKKPKGWAALLKHVKESPIWLELTASEKEFLAAGILKHGRVIFPTVERWIEEVAAERNRLKDPETRGLSRASAFRALRGLVKKGVLVREERRNRFGIKTTSQYTLSEEIFPSSNSVAVV